MFTVDVLECPTCGHKNNNNTPFQDIPINLPQVDFQNGLIFADLIAAVTASETLDEQNLWTCGGCSAPVAAKKTVTYNSLPPVLFTHLKRTGYDQVPFFCHKQLNVFVIVV
jgi:ubiquitin C-terminal hydrolase